MTTEVAVVVSACGRLRLRPFRFVAFSVCGRFGLWQIRFVAVSVVAVSVCGRYNQLPIYDLLQTAGYALLFHWGHRILVLSYQYISVHRTNYVQNLRHSNKIVNIVNISIITVIPRLDMWWTTAHCILYTNCYNKLALNGWVIKWWSVHGNVLDGVPKLVIWIKRKKMDPFIQTDRWTFSIMRTGHPSSGTNVMKL